MDSQLTREHWGSRLGFVLAAVGSAVGLGNIWKFPYITGENGGGLFVLIYLFCIALVGIPIMMAEITIGRSSQKSPVGAFAELAGENSNWKLVGFLGVLSGFVILSYYSVVAGWALNYTFMSLTNFFEGKTPTEIGNTFTTLYTSGGINVFWHAIFMVLVVGVVIGGVKKGIERWNRFLMPVLIMIFVILAIISMFLSGWGEAVDFVFFPHVDRLKPSGVLEALGHAFFTLSLGMGAMLTYGSYLERDSDIPKASIMIGILDTFVALLACMVMFPIIFTYGHDPQAGPGLVFQTLPIIFSEIGGGGMFLSFLFFVLIVFAALSSAVSLLEVVTSYFIDQMEWDRKKATLLTGAIVFLFGIPSALSGSGDLFPQWEAMYGKNFFDTVDYLASNWMLPLGGLFISIYVGWGLDPALRKAELTKGTSWTQSWFYKGWVILLKYIAPVAVMLIIIQRVGLIDIDALLR
ncbi:MAG: sodium-dependent transporter [Candidatus Marinimicrobia bacterium]|nr:sodium-dependent transporter [Candidatus Neomarinimicrobiota bacterium]MCF7828088.1 sodium-dependent transporter [Candidatus Neomarinimicrobiota bacterium]MCF7879737.1 sodium-dependent transporter [Candidatus Neomarinimicrobiota bacterium]